MIASLPGYLIWKKGDNLPFIYSEIGNRNRLCEYRYASVSLNNRNVLICSGTLLSFQVQWSRPLMTSAVQRSDHLFVHRDTPDDRADAKWEFTAENEKVRNAILFLSGHL